MEEWIKEVGEIAALFAASGGLGYALTRPSKRPSSAAPELCAKVRIRLPGGMARATLVAKGPFGWVLGPVIQREGSGSPLAGDAIIVEVPTPKGVTLFRSRIQTVEGAKITVDPPERAFERDRRQNPRRCDLDGVSAAVDGVSAVLVDLSTHGAKVAGTIKAEEGERVELRIGGSIRACWVLESMAEAGRLIARLRFEEPLDERLLKSKAASFV